MPTHPDTREAEEAFRQQDWTKAAMLFDELVREYDAASAKLWTAYARTLRNLGQREDTLQAFERALAISPNELDSWLACGELAQELAELTNDEKESDSWSERAKGKYTQALELVDRRIGTDREDAPSWEIRGEILYRLDRLDESLQSYRKAVAIDPARAKSWVGCGRVLHQLGNLDEALQSYDGAIAVDPAQTVYWAARARILDKLGKVNEAIHSYDKALGIKPEAVYYWFARTKLLDEFGRFDEVLQSYERAIQLTPERASYRKRKARVLQKLGRFEEAQTTAE